ncbi:MAG: hypothetical protein KatS3mg015_2811 [Fimbriimonadales bacterium]|nr:MAG: hypothetical protein KatS3mg015_2811 [Fimbriimonadales bacterium]
MGVYRRPYRTRPRARWIGTAAGNVTPISAFDAGSGSDASTLTVARPVVESGTGSEALGDRSLIGHDSGIGSDASTLVAALVATDSGVGAEASALVVARATTEAGVGVDAASLVASLVVAETGAGVDASSLFTGATNIVASDSGAGVDVVGRFAIVVHDSGAGTFALGTRTLGATDEILGRDLGDADWFLDTMGEDSLALTLHSGGTEALVGAGVTTKTLATVSEGSMDATPSAEDLSLTLIPIDWEPK